MVGLAFAMPAFAAPSKTSETFPQNGQMQEDTKYIGQATETNLHSYEGPVTATANYTDTPYTVTAGNYLPMSSETVAQCTSGNYCPGINGTVNYSTSANQGLTACPGGYGASDLGASENTQCYRTCDSANIGSTITSTPGIAHADGMAGNDYYGTGTDTCYPTSCVAGWHLNPGAPDLATIIGNTEATGSGYRSNDGNNNSNESQYGITQNGEFVVDYGNKGRIQGYSGCSTDGVNNPWYDQSGYTFEGDHFRNALSSNTGDYCWCRLGGYTPLNGTMQSLSTPWVFYDIQEGEEPEVNGCAVECARLCKNVLMSDFSDQLAFRTALFNSIQSTPSCDANVISITWDGADQTDIDANNAASVTYGGDINTPKKAVHVPGKTFVGWTFDTPSGN